MSFLKSCPTSLILWNPYSLLPPHQLHLPPYSPPHSQHPPYKSSPSPSRRPRSFHYFTMPSKKRTRDGDDSPARPRSGSDFGSSNLDPGPFGTVGPVVAVPNFATAGAAITTTTTTTATKNASSKQRSKKPKRLVKEPVPKHAKRRRELPVHACRQLLLSTLSEHSTMVVKGETGSGKTTQIPQYLYEDGWTKRRRNGGKTSSSKMIAVSASYMM